ncbi:hypothetical protein GCM10010347_22050 [Streptomyces cirratus]|uniref:Uncharacterized protein n=1 Tax=Streptomyces cirratus TaxID=68187 RepID=A0ABQ3EQC9_9ACTN|nr:hypothetical protein [Streptomyces cirratus]GHB51817.1 hypothetical protein GCM10010347_22050 [Streptomyces cirratus]
MTDRERNEPPRTTPSHAPGEAGDEEARKEAERAQRGAGGEAAEGEPGEAADALSPSPGAQRSSRRHAQSGDTDSA